MNTMIDIVVENQIPDIENQLEQVRKTKESTNKYINIIKIIKSPFKILK